MANTTRKFTKGCEVMKTKTNVHAADILTNMKIDSCTDGCLKSCLWNDGHIVNWIFGVTKRDDYDKWPRGGKLVKCYEECGDNYCGGHLS
jgi:hypothetical protein